MQPQPLNWLRSSAMGGMNERPANMLKDLPRAIQSRPTALWRAGQKLAATPCCHWVGLPIWFKLFRQPNDWRTCISKVHSSHKWQGSPECFNGTVRHVGGPAICCEIVRQHQNRPAIDPAPYGGPARTSQLHHTTLWRVRTYTARPAERSTAGLLICCRSTLAHYGRPACILQINPATL